MKKPEYLANIPRYICMHSLSYSKILGLTYVCWWGGLYAHLGCSYNIQYSVFWYYMQAMSTVIQFTTTLVIVTTIYS